MRKVSRLSPVLSLSSSSLTSPRFVCGQELPYRGSEVVAEARAIDFLTCHNFQSTSGEAHMSPTARPHREPNQCSSVHVAPQAAKNTNQHPIQIDKKYSIR